MVGPRAGSPAGFDPPRRPESGPWRGDRPVTCCSAVARSIRVFYGKEHGLLGRVRLSFNWAISPPITPLSVVHISAAEATDFGSADVVGPGGRHRQQFHYHLGAADVWVSNVSPRAGGVEFILHVASDSPIDVVVTITIEDAAPQQFRVT